MRHILTITTVTTMLWLSGCSTLASSEAQEAPPAPRVAQKADSSGHYYFSQQIAEGAQASYQNYLDGQRLGRYRGGDYSDASPNHSGHDFWTNGEHAKYDGDFNGHHEHIFLIVDGQLEYLASMGLNATITDTSPEHQQYLGMFWLDFVAEFGLY